MLHANLIHEFRESTIEDEPILGAVLAMPDGRFCPLSWFERVLLALHLTDAPALAAKHFGRAR